MWLSLQKPSILAYLHSFIQMNVDTHSLAYLKLLYTKMYWNHIAINEETFLILQWTGPNLWNLKLCKKVTLCPLTWRVFAEAVTVTDKLNKFHPLTQASLEGLRDDSLTLGPISYPYLPSCTFRKAHCLSQDFTWLAKLTLGHQLAKPGNATVHG